MSLAPRLDVIARKIVLGLVFCVAVIDCQPKPVAPPSVDELAATYVRLALAAGALDPRFIDAYYGPSEWQTDAIRRHRPVGELRSAAASLLSSLKRSATGDRGTFLLDQASSLLHYFDNLEWERPPFDIESRQIYGLTAPKVDEGAFGDAISEMDRLLPGPGSVASRLERFSSSMAVPEETLSKVVDLSLSECRRRTVEHIQLPLENRVEIRYVHGSPWSAYARYQGHFMTRIELNADYPYRPDQILDLMCHEAYPGHHTQYSVQEERFVRARHWIEYQIAPAFSPQSALAEGAATIAPDVAFLPEDREEFEQRVLFPAAGIRATDVARVERVRALTSRLAPVATEAARRYVDGRMTRVETLVWLEEQAAMPRPTDFLDFVDSVRSYIVGYTAAAEILRARVGSSPDRWKRYEEVIADPTGAGWRQGMSMK